MAETRRNNLISTQVNVWTTCPARPHEIDSPDKLQKDYDIVCPNSFMGCSCMRFPCLSSRRIYKRVRIPTRRARRNGRNGRTRN